MFEIPERLELNGIVAGAGVKPAAFLEAGDGKAKVKRLHGFLLVEKVEEIGFRFRDEASLPHTSHLIPLTSNLK
ncbi:MAG: hypothetical protein ACE5FF_03200, partial [Saprospiraceae bacterium]